MSLGGVSCVSLAGKRSFNFWKASAVRGAGGAEETAMSARLSSPELASVCTLAAFCLSVAVLGGGLIVWRPAAEAQSVDHCPPHHQANLSSSSSAQVLPESPLLLRSKASK